MQGYPTANPQQPAGTPVPWTQQGAMPLAGGPRPVPGAWGAPGPGGQPDWARAANSPSLGSLAPGYPGTYPFGNLPGGAPPIRPMPGPASLGPGTAQGSLGTGGVAGVGINPVVAVPPPAVTGGPHPLPTLPAMPLPEGFPNPFEMQQPGSAPGSQQGISPYAPGTTTVTGPRGYLPGLGSFGTPGQGAAFALPQPEAHPLMRALQASQAAQQPPVQTAQPAGQPQPSPFWTALAWQLVNTPATRSALGDRVQRLMEGDSRMRLIQLAASLLLSAELQQAFRALSSGSMQQTPFCTLFAERLRTALETANLEQAG